MTTHHSQLKSVKPQGLAASPAAEAPGSSSWTPVARLSTSSSSSRSAKQQPMAPRSARPTPCPATAGRGDHGR
jgi:hypothetical protein